MEYSFAHSEAMTALQRGWPTPVVEADPLEVLRQFRDRYSFKPTQGDFLEWYRDNLPEDYAGAFC